jgi:hypothetical protein
MSTLYWGAIVQMICHFLQKSFEMAVQTPTFAPL